MHDPRTHVNPHIHAQEYCRVRCDFDMQPQVLGPWRADSVLAPPPDDDNAAAELINLSVTLQPAGAAVAHGQYRTAEIYRFIRERENGTTY